MDYKFLNLEVKIEKTLKLHGLKVNFFLMIFNVNNAHISLIMNLDVFIKKMTVPP